MAKVVAGMTMSLDGFVSDAAGNVDRLYADFNEVRDSPAMTDIIRDTGAVVMGRKMFEMGDPDSWVGTYEFQVPIFVVTTHPPKTPPKQDEHLTFTFVEDGVMSAVTQARAAAGEKLVQVVGGSRLIQDLLRAGQVDELWIDLMPVLLGSGTRLFEGNGLDAVGLETIRVDTLGQRTSFRFRVTG